MTDQLVVAFRNIPEGVTVTPSMMGTGTATDMAAPDATDDDAIFRGRFSPTHVDNRGGAERP